MCDSRTAAQTVPVTASWEQTERQLTIPLEPVESVTITTPVDNVTDAPELSLGGSGTSRQPRHANRHNAATAWSFALPDPSNSADQQSTVTRHNRGDLGRGWTTPGLLRIWTDR
jgi:hypothetical protein